MASGHMTTRGTISLREETFRALLTDIVHSLKVHGFKNIILIGDSGGNQNGQRAVADSLTAIWNGDPVVAHVQEKAPSFTGESRDVQAGKPIDAAHASAGGNPSPGLWGRDVPAGTKSFAVTCFDPDAPTP